jgi:hypothetical protein
VDCFKSYNLYNLGDNLIFLNYLYKQALNNPNIKFIHYLNEKYVSDINCIIDVDNIKICGLKTPSNSGFFNLPSYSNLKIYNTYVNTILKNQIPKYESFINSWIGNENYLFTHYQKNNWTNFHLDYFRKLSKDIGLLNPIINKNDLLFNFKILDQDDSIIKSNLDFLIINSPPLSGQVKNYNPKFLIDLNNNLKKNGFSTLIINSLNSLNDKKLTLIEIALISKKAKYIIGIPNGPMWLTFNTFTDKNLIFRLVLLSEQNLELGKNCITLNSDYQIIKYLVKNGFLKQNFFNYLKNKFNI